MDRTRKSGFVAVVHVFATALVILVSTVQPVVLAGLAGLAALKAIFVELHAMSRGTKGVSEDDILAEAEMTFAAEIPVQAFAGRDFIGAMSEKYAAEKEGKASKGAEKSGKTSPLHGLAAVLALVIVGGAGLLAMNPSMKEEARGTAMHLWQTASNAALEKAQGFGFGMGQTVEAPTAVAERTAVAETQSVMPVAQAVPVAEAVPVVEPIIAAAAPPAQVVVEATPAAPVEDPITPMVPVVDNSAPVTLVEDFTPFVQVDEEAAALVPAVTIAAPVVKEPVPDVVAEVTAIRFDGFAIAKSYVQAVAAMPQIALGLGGMIALFAAGGLLLLTFQRRAVVKSPLVDPFERVVKLRRAELAREAQRMLGGGCLQRA